MVYPEIIITQIDGSTLKIEDITPEYSDRYRHGYGFSNPEKSDMVLVNIKLTVGGVLYEVEQNYDQISRAVFVRTKDLVMDITHVDNGNVSCFTSENSFKSGCTRIEYTNKYLNANSGEFEATAPKIVDIVLRYTEEQMAINAFNRFPFIDSVVSQNVREAAMSELILAWTKLQNLEKFGPDCGCECISSQLNAIRIHLNSIKI